MPFAARDVMKRAATTLQDVDGVRWPATELHGYLNDGLREIVALKPNANTKTVTLSLASGTLQTLPAQYTVLSRVVRNIDSAGTGGRAVRPIADRSIMDAQIPGWQHSEVLPFAKTVVHVIHDMVNPRAFCVVPGNNGAGQIEAVVGAIPAAVPLPASPTSFDDYTATVDIPDLYQNALVDYMLYRAHSKDNGMPNAAARAQAHFELFRGALTNLANAESGISLAVGSNPASAG